MRLADSFSTTSTPRVWFVTGGGRGLGRAFVQAALGAGDRVVATVRTPGTLDGLATAHPEALHVLELDVRERDRVRTVVAEAEAWGGGLDVIVNNAGYGLVGAVEEISEAQARAELDTNLLGALWVCQAVLPGMRERGRGHIVQVSTVGAIGAMPTFGLYNASKWGLEGFSEALAAEVSNWGIRVTIAQLGGFATDWAGSSMRFASPDTAYDDLRRSLFGTATVPWEFDADAADASTDADPCSAAAALLAHVDRPDGPLRLLIGDDAPGHAALALEKRRDDYRRGGRLQWPEA